MNGKKIKQNRMQMNRVEKINMKNCRYVQE